MKTKEVKKEVIFNNTKLIWKGDTFFIWFVSFQGYCKRAAFLFKNKKSVHPKEYLELFFT